MKALRYLAYGSNMHVTRMAYRVPSARLVRVVRLPGWSLRFHKRGRDGSAKCNLLATGEPTEIAHGVIYEIAPGEKANLDRAEGLGRGYDEVRLELPGSGSVFLYMAAAEYVDDTLKPFTWYKRFVVEAARFHGFPEGYVDSLEAVDAVPDPDDARSRENLRLLTRIDGRR